MFESLSNNKLFFRRRSVLGWVSASLVIAALYFLLFSSHDSWALVCTTASGLLLVIDSTLKKETELPHIESR